MTRRAVYVDIPDTTGIEQLNISESYGQTSSVATVVCSSTNLILNSPITIDMGYTDDHYSIFQGRVKSVTYSRAEGLYKLTCRDTLVDASDYFLVAEDPEDPWHRNNIKAEDLVEDLLNVAGITSFVSTVPLSFTYAINAPIEFNFVSVMDAIEDICRTLVWHVWDINGTVHFSDIKPYFRSGADKNEEYGQSGNTDDTISHFLSTAELPITETDPQPKPIITGIERSYSDDDLRNRVIVFGRDDITATADAVSPYLPPNFYKTAVIATPLIDSGTMASQTAQFNLKRFNRLTETAQLDCLGDATIRARQFIKIDEKTTDTSGNWFIETAQHVIANGGFTTKLSVRK
jgi:hypothetical protein